MKRINTPEGVSISLRVLAPLLLLLLYCEATWAVQTTPNRTSSPAKIIVEDGLLKYRDSGEEAAFFGVNYSVPFAHSYRALKKLGKNHKEEIDKDVYHFARLGFDGFRMHIWDTEISDSLGNLVDNEHLQLLDYLLWRLQQRDIKIILTPLTFYNNGYPDGATATTGFANYISKAEAPRNKEFLPVIKRYLEQFITHVNPYTAQSYAENPNIIAVEIINEPAHWGELNAITDFINDLADHLRNSGWAKPIFYNISQNPGVVEAVMNARVDGVGFQWYPAGLVGGVEIKNNYLPYVDAYTIPFKDEPAFKSKAQMVYEFDSADVLHSYAYPAMARSFREAGFQWATQFAYDPLAIAYANSDYQTHYLNLAYTPAKAISMLIASMVFHHTPLHKNYGGFPADTLFGAFHLSHSLDLSEMNADTVFYYSNHTQTSPRNPKRLKHVAGVGSSPVVSYKGLGAYFLDKLEDGIWRLELMPDAVHSRDPFERPSFNKHVTHISWRDHPMKIELADLGGSFRIQGLNTGNERNLQAEAGAFVISPGTYLLLRSGKNNNKLTAKSKMGHIELGEFVAPPPSPDIPMVKHDPYQSVVAGKPVQISAIVSGTSATDKVWLIAGSGWRPQRIVMQETRPCVFEAKIPAEAVNSGLLNYWIVIEQKDKKVTFPGNHAGSPSDWDYYYDESWQVPVVNSASPLELFNARKDHAQIKYAFSRWNRGYQQRLVATEASGQMAIQSTVANRPEDGPVLGWKIYVGDKVAGRSASLDSLGNLVVKAKATNGDHAVLKIILVDKKGGAFNASVTIAGNYAHHKVSIDKFKSDAMLLLPRPFPPFMPLWFGSSEIATRALSGLQDLAEVQFLLESNETNGAKTYGFEIELAWLE